MLGSCLPIYLCHWSLDQLIWYFPIFGMLHKAEDFAVWSLWGNIRNLIAAFAGLMALWNMQPQAWSWFWYVISFTTFYGYLKTYFWSWLYLVILSSELIYLSIKVFCIILCKWSCFLANVLSSSASMSIGKV